MKFPARRAGNLSSKRGLTLAETVVSTMIVGVLLVAALSAVSAARRSEQKLADKMKGAMLAQELMAEILQQAYQDPDLPTLVLAAEANELLAGNRGLFDDVDDYNLWSRSPPEQRDGTAFANLSGWRRSAKVEWVSAANPAQVSLVETGVKRITVTVSRDNAEIAVLTAIRTNAWQDAVTNQTTP